MTKCFYNEWKKKMSGSCLSGFLSAEIMSEQVFVGLAANSYHYSVIEYDSQLVCDKVPSFWIFVDFPWFVQVNLDCQPWWSNMSISTQNLFRRQLIIHEVCVLDRNRTSFSMATRGSTLGNFGCPCQIVSLSFVWGNANQGIWTFVKFWKNTYYFQTNWISCIVNWGVRCDVVSDASHTCCCC